MTSTGVTSSNDAVIMEAAVLSILVSFPQMMDSVGARLRAAHFSDQRCRQLFMAINSRIAAGASDLDTLTLHDDVRDYMSLSEAHEILTSHDHTARGITTMVDRLVERHKERELRRLSIRFAELAGSPTAHREAETAKAHRG